ncbi:ABC transporter permease [Motiliproteus sp. MSK22-1]|uniref:ABC transporter permease n=1 Tax=Motiliproteus sp. MSK22-1 TaxID=1897630 RepID=UPI000975B09B|nr:FtsX-like permease family protein [Motiliproteus sp. MSK22-1]OMH39143.1 hypothetical protein BGP75_05445 [Motiliproteus sp. MSK22-1]
MSTITTTRSPTVSLALKLLWREWRGGELRLLLIALMIAVTASCAVGFFTDRVERALVRQATEFLGADLVLRTSRAFPENLRAEATQRNLQYSEQLVFPSMLINGEKMLLSSVKVVDDHYPLKGEVKVSTGRDQVAKVIKQGPSSGELWLEPRVLESLNMEVGDSVELGASVFTVSQMLIQEPDRGGGLFSLQPRAMMHQSDIAATEVIQPGSRIRYRYLFNGSEADLEPFRDWLEERLKPGERILDIQRESPSLGTTLTRAQSYLNLSGLMAVIMAGIAIAMAARRYSERHYDTAALLRCFGQPQRHILKLYSLQLMMAGTLASAAGVGLGWMAQYILVELLSGLVPGTLPGPGLVPALVGFCTGMLVLAGFALPPLLRLSDVTPLRVLRRDLSPLPRSAWLVYGLSALLILMLLWAYSRDLKLTLVIAGIGSIGALILGVLAWILLRSLVRIPGPLAWRLASKNLLRHPRDSLSQLFAFGITLAAMALILIVRSDLLQSWQEQLPDQAPNNFLINIQPWQVEELEGYLDNKQIPHSGVYPMVRGRLSHINGQEAAKTIPEQSPGRRAISRELNLTWSDTLAADNRILEGRWWQPEDQGKPYISLERDLARDLGVGIGDKLRFSFGDRSVESEIISLRSLDWGSLRPNFYVIYPPGALEGLPANFITSFYLPNDRSAELNQLIQQFPTLTLLEVDRLLAQIRSIIEQVSIAVEYVLMFVLAAGITVLFAALATSIDERLQEGALLRTLGGNSKTLRRMLGLEFLLMGALAGILAALLDEAVSFWLYQQLFKLEYNPNLALWLWSPLAGAALVGCSGLLGTRKVIKQSPLKVLREL